MVIPAVDILDGSCVQLVGGKAGTGKKYGDPAKAAIDWVERGAEYLHLVDLDAAMGRGDNSEKVAQIIKKVNIPVEVGGGIRSVARAKEILDTGADKIILGTIALRNPGIIKEIADIAGGEKIIVALDARDGKVLVEGWQTATGVSVIDKAREFADLGIGGILFTDVGVEGRMVGLAMEATRNLVEAVNIPVIASGGVSTLDDVRAAKDAGAAALVVGTALYENKFTLEQAMEVAK